MGKCIKCGEDHRFLIDGWCGDCIQKVDKRGFCEECLTPLNEHSTEGYCPDCWQELVDNRTFDFEIDSPTDEDAHPA